MIQLFATLRTLGAVALDKATTRDERGSVTIEQVLWALAVIVFVGIVFAIIQQYVKDRAAEIDNPIQ